MQVPRTSIAIVVLAVLTCYGLPTKAWDPANGDWSKTETSDLRVMTWNVADNIRSSVDKVEGWSAWHALARIVAAMRPDILIIQEAGDNGCYGCVDSVEDLTTVVDLFFHGGEDPFLGGTVQSWVQKYAPDYDLSYIFVTARTDQYNRNVIVSRYPFMDLNGDTRSQLDDVPMVMADEYAPSGNGGIRGFQFVEIDLLDAVYLGDLVVGGAHLKAGSSGSDQEQRLKAGKIVAYVIDYWYNGAGTGVPDPHGKIVDNPPATVILPDNTPVVIGGDWNEDELTNGRKGPADWLTKAELTGPPDGTDRDRSDMTYDSATHPFTGSRTTYGSSKLDYIAWQDSIATLRRTFIFDTSGTPSEALPPELLGFPFPSGASGMASDHRTVVIDLILPLAEGCDNDSDCDDGLFCNGAETCVDSVCQPGADPCPGQTCDEVTDTCGPLPSADPWINEFHYDNDGTDTGEFVEIAGPAETNLTGWQVLGYNGNGGAVYKTVNLSGTIPDQEGCLGTLAFSFTSMQNGSPDGLVLVDPVGTVIEFLSYEGSFTATDGPAAGMSSTDIGVYEPSSSPVGHSLQLSGTGSQSSDFTWQSPATETPGLLNNDQTFDGCGDGIPTVSEWGLAVMTLLMLTTGTLILARRQLTSTSRPRGMAQVHRGIRVLALAGLVTAALSVGASAGEAPIGPDEGRPCVRWQDAGKVLKRTAFVHGQVRDVERRGRVTLLSFNESGANGFAAVVFNRFLNRFPKSLGETYNGQLVRVRGFVTTYAGRPQIYVTTPDQIEILTELPSESVLPETRISLGEEITVATFNVLNLFDNVDDPYRNDDSTPTKPRTELERVAWMIREINADVLALQEVESHGYLERFLDVFLPDMGYDHIVHLEGNDMRGIDVCLVSRVPVGPVTSYRHVTFHDQNGTPRRFSRDLLCAQLEPAKTEPFEVWVVHLKSNYDGRSYAEPIRLAEATKIRELLDRQLRREPTARIVLCGDFNDTWDSTTVRTIMGTGPLTLSCFAHEIPPNERITYNREPYRSMIDFILCSPHMATAYVQGSYSIHPGSIESIGSDHNPVIARFQLND